MNGTLKKVLSFALALVMVVGMLPASALVALADTGAAYQIGDTFGSNKSDADLPTNIPANTVWEQTSKCSSTEHTHTDSCYVKTLNCEHKQHDASCVKSGAEKCGKVFCSEKHIYISLTTKYHTSDIVCTHTHTDECYEPTSLLDFAKCPTRGSEHTHDDTCFVWTLRADANDNGIADGTTDDPYYTVKYVDNDKVLAEETYTNVLKDQIPSYAGDTQRDGYTLTWSGPVISDLSRTYTYTAVWTLIDYTITWNCGEGAWKDGTEGTTKTQEKLHYGDTLTAPEVVAPDGKSFAGWDPKVDKVTENVTYTATYSNDTFVTVTYKVNGEPYDTQRINVTKRETVTAPAAPTDLVQQIFCGWDKDLNGKTVDVDTEVNAVLKADLNSNGVADESETYQVALSVSGNGTATLTNNGKEKILVTDNGGGTWTVVCDSTQAGGSVVYVATTAGTTEPTYSAVYLKGINGSESHDVTVTGNNQIITVTFEVETFTLKNGPYEIAANGHDFSSIINNLKKEILNVVLTSTDYDPADYKVEYFVGNIPFTDTKIYWDVESSIASLLNTLRINEVNKFKITKLAKSNLSGVDLYHEGVEITLVESREKAELGLTKTDYTEDTLADVINAIKANVTANGAAVNADDVTVTLDPQTDLTTTKQTYTATVKVKDSKDYLETTKKFTITADIKTYNVTWIADGSTVETKTYPYGETIVAPADPEKTGHTFKGWEGWTEGTTASKDVTYTAKFTVNQHDVIWYVDGVEVKRVPYNYGETPVQIEKPTKTGYTFSDWSALPETMPDEDVKVYGTFTVNQYDVIWKWKNAEGDQTTTVTADYGSGITVPSQIPTSYKVGHVTYTLTGWTGLENGATVPVDGVTYTATYTTATAYVVTFDSQGGSTVTSQTIIVENNDVVTEPADPTREGYRFDGWYNGETKYEFGSTIAADLTLTAHWVKLVTVSFDVEGIDDQIIDVNTAATKPADPSKTGFVFDGWYLGDKEYDFTALVTEDIALTAKWLEDTNKNGVADEEETIEVTIIGNGTVDGNSESYRFVYDSKNPKNVTLKVLPSMVDGVSKTFVSKIKVGGEEQTFTYNAKYGVDLSVYTAQGNAVEVTFTDCGFDYIENGWIRFYVGMEDPNYETLYKGVIAGPEYNEAYVKSVKYLARPAGTYTFKIPELGTIDLSIFGKYPIGGGSYDVDLTEAWLDVSEYDDLKDNLVTEEQLQKTLDDAMDDIKAKFEAIDLTKLDEAYEIVKELTKEISDLVSSVTASAKYLGYHEFGASGTVDTNGHTQEILQVIYDNGAMHLEDDNVVITLIDDRIETTITGGDLTYEYDEYTDADIMGALKLTDVDGNPVEGELYKYTGLAGKNVGEYTYTVTYKGSWDYKPCTATFTLTVIKAPSNTDVPNVNITYGDESYPECAKPSITNKHDKEIDIDYFEFFLGLDVAELDIDGDGVKGLVGRMQLMLPKKLQTILDGLGLKDGATMSISELMGLLQNDTISGVLENWGITSQFIDTLQQILDAINNVVETGDLQITIGGQYPTNVGFYLHGAITADGNYETSFDFGYVVIMPDATKAELQWNADYTIWTTTLLQQYDLGAGAYVDSEKLDIEVPTLFFGISTDGSVVFTWDGTELTNGAYTELAFLADWGNTFYYAMPIVRAFVIVPDLIDVTISVDGAEVTEGTKNVRYDGEPVDVTMDYELTFTYDRLEEKLHFYGIQTDGTLYDSDVAPTHAGAYTVVATVVAYDADGGYLGAGAAVCLLTIEPADSAIELTGGDVNYDGKGHTATVDANGADYILISGGAYVTGDVDTVGINALHGNVNIDLPDWMDALLKDHTWFTDGVDTAYLIKFLAQYEDKLGDSYDALISVLKALPEDVNLTFRDNVTYTEPGYYYFYGVVVDPDLYPSTDSCVLHICKLDYEFGAWHTVTVYDGKEHKVFVPNDTFGPVTVDYLTMILDRERNDVNFVLEDDAQWVLDTIEKALGFELPKEISISALREKLNAAGLTLEQFADILVEALEKILAGMEEPTEEGGSVYRTLQTIRDMLLKLPADGSIRINGKLPVDVGAYEFYVFAYSEDYETQSARGVLFIEPIHIVVDDIANEKYYGQTDPALTASVSYYGYAGLEDPADADHSGNFWYDRYDVTDDGALDQIHVEKTTVTTLPDDVKLVYSVTREAGEDVGTYELYVNASIVDSRNYVLETVEDDEFTIKPAKITEVVASGAYTYNGTEQTVQYVVKAGDLVLGADDFTVTGVTGTDADTYTIKVTGKGNFTGSAETTWKINPAQITVTVKNAGITVGSAVPAVDYDVTMTGTVTDAQLNLKLQWKTDGKTVGSYGFESSYNTSTNWNVSFNEAVLNVTAGNFVCWNMKTGKYYEDLSDALAEADDAYAEVGAQTVQMLKDYTEQYVMIGKGITLDLAGCTVTAKYAAGFNGSCLTGAINSGKLVIASDGLILAEKCYYDGKYDVLPIWVVDESLATGGYYTFFRFEATTNVVGATTANRGLKIDEEAKSIYFKFGLNMSGAVRPFLSDGGLDNNMYVAVRLTWETETGTAIQEFVYSEKHLKDVVGGKYDFTFTLNEYDELSINIDTLTIQPVVVTENGAISCGEMWYGQSASK